MQGHLSKKFSMLFAALLFWQGRSSRRASSRQATEVGEALEGLRKDAREAWDLDDRPLLLKCPAMRGWFGFDHLREACDAGEMSEAGQGLLGSGGSWQMRRVGTRGSSVPWNLVEECLESRKTVVFNSADAACPRLASLSLAALDVFRLPVCVNLYATGAATSVSAPPHTDKQRVFVLQTEGKKRWRVYSPPDPRRQPSADPLARGKGDDALAFSELDQDPIFDVVLSAGQALYVPAGYPHTTATADDDQSLHVTLGVDTHIWGIDPISARAGALKRKRLADKLRPELDLDPRVYWLSGRSTLPLHSPDAAAKVIGESARAMEPERWATDEDAMADLDAASVADRLRAHAETLVSVQKEFYAKVVSPSTSGPPPLSQYYAQLEAAQLDLLNWYEGGKDDEKEKASQYVAGDKVKVLMLGTENEWFDAVVDSAHLDGTVDVVYFDGELERSVPSDRVLKARKKAASPSQKRARGGFSAAEGSAKKKKKKVSSKRR